MFPDIFNTNWTEAIDVFIRSFLSLITLFLITKLLGKKQVSELSVFDYVIGISIGNFAAEMTISLESQYINGILAILIFGGVAYLVDVITLKSVVLRRFFMGVPTILIQEGEIIKKNLRRVKFDINDLLEECRGNGYFDLNEIQYAIMEANGKISILPKSENKPVSIKDMNLQAKKQGLCANVIIDGKIMHNNLLYIDKDEDWLRKQLKIKGYNDLTNIILATVDVLEKLTIYEKGDKTKIKNVLE